MADVTSTSFGFLIAFLLPGLTLLYALTFWSSNARHVLDLLATAPTNWGLFLFVMVAGVTVSLMVTVIRWLIFECLWYKIWHRKRRGKEPDSLEPDLFLKLTDEHRLAAFRAVAEEHYRYHQFWGGMTVVVPVLGVGWLRTIWSTQSAGVLLLLIASLVVLEGLTCAGAVAAYSQYVQRGRSILKGG